MKRIGWALFVMTTGANMPAPLFPFYQRQYHLSALMVTFLFAIYAICLIPCMLIVGSWAKHYDPKRLTLIGVSCAIVATGLFLWDHQAWQLFLARSMEGISLGLFMGPGTALFIQQSPSTSRIPVVTGASVMTMVGFGLGPLIAAITLGVFSARQEDVSYILLLVALLSAWGGLATLTPRKRILSAFESSRQTISFSTRTRFWRLYAPAGFTLFALNGTAIALIPADAARVFHTTNPLWAGILLFVVLGGGGVVQFSHWPQDAVQRIRWGMGCLLAGAWLMIAASFLQSPALLLEGMALQALGGGWTFQAALYGVTHLTDFASTAVIMSWFYIAAYVGMIIPVLFTGWITDLWGLPTALGVLGVFMTTGGLVTLYQSKAPIPPSTLEE